MPDTKPSDLQVQASMVLGGGSITSIVRVSGMFIQPRASLGELLRGVLRHDPDQRGEAVDGASFRKVRRPKLRRDVTNLLE